ncbi:hypothetical protein PQR57_45525 [Paraburkholderia dipogonis]|jgi:uncharacterized protein YjaG (DUF416 family)|uniref:Secreted protein n=1 Tax=Paraburkholderia dipogonis TaxID=1211383 RepID=A0ABW9B638_9BURK
MSGFYVVAPAIAACIAMYSISPTSVRAQTGAAATKQMQYTQRAAQKKAREAKNDTRDQMQKENEAPPAPASGEH